MDEQTQRAYDRNHDGLMRVLAMMLAMTGWSSETAGDLQGGQTGPGAMLARAVYYAVLRLLRPAESATRRLIVTLASAIKITLPAPRKPKAKPEKSQYVGPFGNLPQIRRRWVYIDGVLTGLTLRPGERLPKGAVLQEGQPGARRQAPFQLIDPLKRFCRGRGKRIRPSGAPNIRFLDSSQSGIVAAPQTAPDAEIDAPRLSFRLAALALALGDMPRQAMRLAPWQARQDRMDRMAKLDPALPRQRGMRLSALRSGRAPGAAPVRVAQASLREIDEVLADASFMARIALERRRHPDTS